MHADDRVLVGVINRKRDLRALLDEHWYRIPQQQAPRGVYAEYIAFYLSGSAARGYDSTGVHYYARRSGLELLYRRDLLPAEADHPRAGDIYYKVQFAGVLQRVPPIINPTRRSLSFIHTTWDRFSQARQIADLYSEADYYVDRIYHALRERHIRAECYWEAEASETGVSPQVRILCERGTVVASVSAGAGVHVLLNADRQIAETLQRIEVYIQQYGGALRLIDGA